MVARFADELELEIRREALNYNQQFGWRLLYSPVEVLGGADVAFIGLNPGGTGAGQKLDYFAMPPKQSAYRDEIWSKQSEKGAAPLQLQALKIFAYLQASPHKVLAGNIVPFRTPKWKYLNGETKRAALQFGSSLWTRIFERAKPEIVITFGRDAGTAVAGILDIPFSEDIDSGWGKIKIKRGRTNDVCIVGLPHLSRIRIFGRRDKALEPFSRAFGDLR